MNINKIQSIRKGFFLSSKKFPVALALSSGLLVQLMGCNRYQGKNAAIENGAKVGPSRRALPLLYENIPGSRLPIERAEYKKILESQYKPNRSKPESFRIKAYIICQLLYQNIHGKGNHIDLGKNPTLEPILKAIEKLIEPNIEQCKLFKQDINDCLTTIETIALAADKRQQACDDCKKLHEKYCGCDVESLKDVLLCIEQRFKALDALINQINKFSKEKQDYEDDMQEYEKGPKNYEEKEKKRGRIKQFMVYLSELYIELKRNKRPKVFEWSKTFELNHSFMCEQPKEMSVFCIR